MTAEEEQSGGLRDGALADEIELVSDLVVAASSSPRHFTLDEVDQLLGIGGEPATETASETLSETGSGGVDGPSVADPAP